VIVFTIRRIAYACALLFFAATIIFFIVYLTPGNPYARMQQEMAERNPAALSQISASHWARLDSLLGLDRPIHEQYVAWIRAIALGDMGDSWSVAKGQAVSAVVLSRTQYTLLMLVTATVVPLGLYSAVHQYTNGDFLITAASYFGMAMPSFWFGFMLIAIFFSALGWLPLGGVASRDLAGTGDILTVIGRVLSLGQANPQIAGLEWPLFVDGIKHLIMPTATLSLVLIARWTRFLRTSTLEVLRQDYIRAARARGVPGWAIILKHCLRNSLIPLITAIALDVPTMFTGSFIIENIFNWPGIGRLYIDSLRGGDWPLLLGLLITNAVLLIAANLVADLAYRAVDPRINYSGA
jgi:peptide/nickel transport system permease protein